MKIPFTKLHFGPIQKSGPEQPVIVSDDPRFWANWSLDGVSLDKRAGEEIPDIAQASAQLRSNIGWLYAVVNRISKETCRYELKISKKQGKLYSDAEDLKASAFIRALERPYPYGDIRSLVETLSVQINLTGKTTAQILTVGGAGIVFDKLIPINPAFMTYDIDQEGVLYRWLNSAKKRYLDPEQVFYAHYADPTDIYRPLSPVKCISGGIELYKQVMNYNWKWLKNDTQASAYGSPKDGVVIDQPKYEKLKEWARKQIGKIGGIEFLPVGMDLVARNVAQRQLQFGGDIPVIAQEICNGYGYMLPLLNGQNINRSVMEVCQYLTLELCVRPHAMVLESALNSQITHRFLGPDYWLYFDIPEFKFSEDTAKIIQNELQYNLISREEYRSEHNRDPEFSGTEPNPKVQITIPSLPEEQPVEETKPAKTIKLIPSGKQGPRSRFKSEERYFEWKAFDVLVDSLQDPFRDTIMRSFRRQGSQLKQKVQAAYDRGEPLRSDMFDQDSAKADLVKISTSHIVAAAKAGYKNGMRLARKKDKYESNEIREAKLRHRTKSMAEQTTKTTAEKVLELFESTKVNPRGKAVPDVSVSVSMEEFLKAIDDLFEGFDYRAVLGAETQTVGTLNWGADQAFRDAGVDGSEWLSQQDDRVRSPESGSEFDHNIDGEIIQLGQEFSNGLHFPGDIGGSKSLAGNLINCRCATLPYLKEEE